MNSLFDIEYLKVPSACNTDTELLDYLCQNFNGKVHISLGMVFSKEIDHIIKLFRNNGRLKDLVIYSCTSSYPAEFEDIFLLDIVKYKEAYGELVDCLGFSGHHHGIALDIAAYALGATFIERHFTFSRTAKGTDHAASLEPQGLRKLVRDLNAVSKTLKFKNEMSVSEMNQRKKLKNKFFDD